MKLPLQAIIIGLAMNALWGGNAVSIKMSLEAFPPLWTAFLRFTLGIACVVAWAKLKGHRLRPPRTEWRGLASCTVLFTVQIWLLNTGLDGTSGAMGSILLATFPLWGAIASSFLLSGEQLTVRRSIGMLIAFSGAVIVLMRGEGVETLSIAGVGNAVVLVSSALLGLRLAWAARVMRGVDNLRLTVWQMALSLPFFLGGAVLSEEIAWEAVTWRPIVGLLYNGIVIAGLGFTINNLFLKRYNASAVISLGFITPIFGVLGSAWILGDTLTWSIASGVGAVAIGLTLATRSN
jgi:drug/metabolite transporter (DMT)-like permease